MKKLICLIFSILLIGCNNNSNVSSFKNDKKSVLELLNIQKENIQNIELYDYKSNFVEVTINNKDKIDNFISCIDIGYTVKQYDLSKYNVDNIGTFIRENYSYTILINYCSDKNQKEELYIYKNYIYFKNYNLSNNEIYVSDKQIFLKEMVE